MGIKRSPFKTKQTEKSVQLSIKQLLAYSGWRIKRVPPSLYADKGWCDLIAIKNGCTLFIECKNPVRSKWNKQQQQFAQEVSDAGCIYLLASSIDIVEDTIKKVFYDNENKKWELT